MRLNPALSGLELLPEVFFEGLHLLLEVLQLAFHSCLRARSPSFTSSGG